ncbi:hypothetical protein MPTK1_2g17180 [Marchantia polymorpha subsp. ruderalis]|uniref:Uncharacterized protein n=1 Tax=Marchantia polymorpha TaxID=3197 RepID=A0A2R6WCR0_MARPO|nr:hypothetical protein MARPO_0109s0059 [Marchantia polymorpha]BBN02681.1 hypothetical protein Mp_2g17180 [Marchantia polymorpha subsp. ruderalis]|eukprot:PTQ31639.1 hypothetical protein MARPO_0109s0059 [Marchantia polymorpha]
MSSVVLLLLSRTKRSFLNIIEFNFSCRVTSVRSSLLLFLMSYDFSGLSLPSKVARLHCLASIIPFSFMLVSPSSLDAICKIRIRNATFFSVRVFSRTRWTVEELASNVCVMAAAVTPRFALTDGIVVWSLIPSARNSCPAPAQIYCSLSFWRSNA